MSSVIFMMEAEACKAKQFLKKRVYTCVEVIFELIEKIVVKCLKK